MDKRSIVSVSIGLALASDVAPEVLAEPGGGASGRVRRLDLRRGPAFRGLDRAGDGPVRSQTCRRNFRFWTGLEVRQTPPRPNRGEGPAKGLGTTPEQGLRDLTGGDLIFAIEGEDRAFLIVTPSDREFLVRAHERILELACNDAADHDRPDPIKSDVYRETNVYSVAKGEARAIVLDRLVHARLTVQDRSGAIRFRLNFDLGNPR